jgi:hypothetical protein
MRLVPDRARAARRCPTSYVRPHIPGRFRAVARWAPWWLIACVLTGCGNTESPYFPRTPGKWWYFSSETIVRGEDLRQRVFVRNLRLSGNELVQQHQATGAAHYRFDRDGVWRLPGAAGPTQPARILPRQPASGETWEVPSELRVIDSRTFAAEDRVPSRREPITLTATIVALDATVSVPAGRYTRCVLLQLTGSTTVKTDRGNTIADVQVAQQEWYAPRIGLVKLERNETSTSPFLRDGVYRQELLEHGD